MRKKTDPFVGKSHGRLREATLRLLDERSPETVTITDIVTEAGLTRPTFYATFGDLSSAFADAAVSRLEVAFSGMTLAGDLPETERADAMESAFLTIITRIDAHVSFFARVLRGPGGVQVHERLVQFLAARLRENSPLSAALARGPLPVDIASNALAAGITWTILAWLDDDSRSSSGHLAKLLRDLILYSVVGGLSQPVADNLIKES